MPDLRLNFVANDRASSEVRRIDKGLEAAGREARKTARIIEDGSRRSDRALKKTAERAKKTSTAFSNFGSVLRGIFVGATAIQTLRFVGESITLFGKQEEAVNDLALALRNLGRFSNEALRDQVQFAASLQQVTTFGDEQIIALQALLVQFGLYGEELKAATVASLDFAAAQKRDVNTAALLVGKAFVGQTAELSRYGIILDEGIPKTEKFAAVIDQLNRRFGGAAQEQIRNVGGQIQQLSNRFGDLREVIGEEALPVVDAWLRTLNAIITATNNLTGAQAADQSVQEAGIQVIEKEINALELQLATLDRFGKAQTEEGKRLEELISIRQRQIEALRLEQRQIEDNADTQVQATEETSSAVIERTKEQATALQELNKIDADLRQERLLSEGMDLEARQEMIQRELEARIEAIDAAFAAAGSRDLEARDRAIQNAEIIAQAQREQIEKQKSALFELQSVGKAVAGTIENEFSSALAESVVEGKTFEEAFKGIFKSIADAAIRELGRIAVQQAFASFAGFGGFGAGAALVGGGLPGFQRGTRRVPGPVGRPVLARVEGGETISTPFSTGSGQAGGVGPGGGGGGVTVNISLQVADLNPAERRRILNQMAEEIRLATDAGRTFSSEVENAIDANAGRSS